jgi:hypothetical protein
MLLQRGCIKAWLLMSVTASKQGLVMVLNDADASLMLKVLKVMLLAG